MVPTGYLQVRELKSVGIDEIRKEEWRKMEGNEKKYLKGLRWLLIKHSKNRTKSNTRILNQLRNSNHRIHRAWVLKDEFAEFWDYLYKDSAEKLIKGWMSSVRRSRLKPMIEFVKTIDNHFDNAFLDMTYLVVGDLDIPAQIPARFRTLKMA